MCSKIYKEQLYSSINREGALHKRVERRTDSVTSRVGEEETLGVHEVGMEEIDTSNTTLGGSEQLHDSRPVGERILVQLEATI